MQAVKKEEQGVCSFLQGALCLHRTNAVRNNLRCLPGPEQSIYFYASLVY